jgi:ribosomal protein L40E
MAKKTLGYTELQWTCPNCTALNPGSEKSCLQCGAPQPEDVAFEQVKGAELIQDEAVEARVDAGPDIHCPYCNARNPGDAKICSQCGGDIIGGEKRKEGQVLGAYKEESINIIPCPHCGAEIPETEKICPECGGSMFTATQEAVIAPTPRPADQPGKKRIPLLLIIILALGCIGIGFLIFLSMRTEAVTGTVNRIGWERSIAIEGLIPVEYRDWRDNIPKDGEIMGCQQEVRSVEDQPQPNSEEVCGTPYSIDTGSGYAEIVQDCQYYVYDDYCTFSVMEWTVVDTISNTGSDFYPEWPEPVINNNQRLGTQTEVYTIIFDTGNGEVSYSLDDYQVFLEFQPDTRWNLEINSFGNLVSVSP